MVNPKKQFISKFCEKSQIQNINIQFDRASFFLYKNTILKKKHLFVLERQLSNLLQNQFFIRIYKLKSRSFTVKGTGARMGSGKGDIAGYKYYYSQGDVLFECIGLIGQKDLTLFNQVVTKLEKVLPVKLGFKINWRGL